MKFKHLNYEDYKEIAEKFLRDFPYGIGNIPTNIDLLIEKAGYQLEAIEGLRDKYGVKGLIAKDTNNKGPIRILIDAKHYERDDFEYKFTLAEELGHALIHLDFYDEIYNVDDYIKEYNSTSESDYRKFEQQARNIASFILLPHDLFNRYVLEYVEIHLASLKNYYYESPENFSALISRAISREIVLSTHVIEKTISLRYPNRIIDNIVDKFGKELKI